ncbi:MAG: hypothetical protein ACW99G_03470 [Candidatus Thorarchaeota archaeon]|jgi:hypothetical protein
MQIDDDLEYNPALLGFVLDIKWPNINTVKLQVVESIRHMESDERAYTYSPDNLSIPRWPGESVSSVANFHHYSNFDIANGIKQTIILFSQEDFSFKKHLFVLTDGYSRKQDYKIKRALSWNEKEDCECECYFLSVGEDNSDLRSLCESLGQNYLHTPSVEDVHEAVSSIYKTQEMPFFVKNYQRLDMGILRKKVKHEKEYLAERENNGFGTCCETDSEDTFRSLKRECYYPISWSLREGCDTDKQHSLSHKKQPLPNSSSG